MTLHCPMIHGGLQLNIKDHKQKIQANQCCLRHEGWEIDPNTDFFKDPRLQPLRGINLQERWAPGCENCQRLEAAGSKSFRQGTLEMFGQRTDYSGPVRLDLMFDTSCNLACRSCGPEYSTFWQRHLKEQGRWLEPIRPVARANEVIRYLDNINLDDLQLIVYCGGETLLGSSYWEIAEYFAQRVPNAKDQLILSFQTNGTQPINEKYHAIMEKFRLVKLNISLDGVGERFEFLRWPACWNDVVDNLMNMRNDLPSNVMFLVEETVSLLNIYYQKELAQWVQSNFCSNRESDVIDHTRHMANGIFGMAALTDEYVSYLLDIGLAGYCPRNFTENPALVQQAIKELQTVDQWRQQDWTRVFPEVAEFYSRYL